MSRAAFENMQQQQHSSLHGPTHLAAFLVCPMACVLRDLLIAAACCCPELDASTVLAWAWQLDSPAHLLMQLCSVLLRRIQGRQVAAIVNRSLKADVRVSGSHCQLQPKTLGLRTLVLAARPGSAEEAGVARCQGGCLDLAIGSRDATILKTPSPCTLLTLTSSCSVPALYWWPCHN
eukprot:364926-Chlamydomonas_euryale.AAC.3